MFKNVASANQLLEKHKDNVDAALIEAFWLYSMMMKPEVFACGLYDWPWDAKTISDWIAYFGHEWTKTPGVSPSKPTAPEKPNDKHKESGASCSDLKSGESCSASESGASCPAPKLGVSGSAAQTGKPQIAAQKQLFDKRSEPP